MSSSSLSHLTHSRHLRYDWWSARGRHRRGSQREVERACQHQKARQGHSHPLFNRLVLVYPNYQPPAYISTCSIPVSSRILVHFTLYTCPHTVISPHRSNHATQCALFMVRHLHTLLSSPSECLQRKQMPPVRRPRLAGCSFRVEMAACKPTLHFIVAPPPIYQSIHGRHADSRPRRRGHARSSRELSRGA